MWFIYIRPEKERLRPDRHGPDGIFAGIDPGTILVDMGTHSLESTLEMATKAGQAPGSCSWMLRSGEPRNMPPKRPR